MDTTLGPTTDTTQPRRKPFLSFLLSLVQPGLGHIYNGDARVGLGIIFTYTVWITGSRSLFKYSGWSCALVVFFTLVFLFGVIFHAARRGLEESRKAAQKLNSLQKVWVYVLIVVVNTLILGMVNTVSRYPSGFNVPSSSMLPSILLGEHLLADPDAYTRSTPNRGDVVVFFYTPDKKSEKSLYIKRVIGLPGDVIEVRQGRIILNQKSIPREMASESESQAFLKSIDDKNYTNQTAAVYWEQLNEKRYPVLESKTLSTVDSQQPPSYFGPLRVPEGQYFLMGDNRGFSFDSRFFGPVAKDKLVGKALFITYQNWLDFKQKIFKFSISRLGYRP